jgi:arsenate reductase (thioredoxin)
MGAMMTSRPVPTELARVIELLTDEFAGVFAPETVRDCVVDSFKRLQEGARITGYLPLLAHRFARERLRACGLAQGSLPKPVPVVLFVCTHNAGRSQLAAALLAQAAGDQVLIASAGTAPASTVEPAVLEVLAERGIDASDAYPKPLTEEVVAAADVVITMGCGDACPILPGRRYLDWDLADPMGGDVETVRAIRDDIEARVQLRLIELLPTTAEATS